MSVCLNKCYMPETIYLKNIPNVNVFPLKILIHLKITEYIIKTTYTYYGFMHYFL